MGANSDLAAVLESLHPAAGDTSLIGADPRLCAQALRVDGIAVSVTTDSGLGELLWSTEGTSTRLEDLQYELGQGPGHETALYCAPVLVPDLARVPTGRWPALLPEAAALGVGAVFCFPLSVGSACLGTLTLQQTAPGPLPDATVTDAWLLANALAALIVEGSPQQSAFAVATEGSDFYRAAVHQASGMISVQADISLAQALLRLRTHAFRHGRSLTEVAQDVVSRRLSFRDDEKGPDIPAGEGTEGP
ncbi:GAF and ANTAR domain-containing protein [Streptomyces aureocirculatus]|uniref:GAF and ANTAR domain-containing protein n=1 Tax=Streptomyces aureocirculatus TaxID=67275 RepID=UPI0004C9FB79|nr:ANTAR domain-containing protein [Streptomyces aureocirculatus]